MSNYDECCGTCRYHRTQGDEWTCFCEESDNYGLETEYGNVCDNHESRISNVRDKSKGYNE